AFELDDFERDRILQQEWSAGGQHHFEAILAYSNLPRNLPINPEFRCKQDWGGAQKSCQDQLDTVFIYQHELTKRHDTVMNIDKNGVRPVPSQVLQVLQQDFNNIVC